MKRITSFKLDRIQGLSYIKGGLILKKNAGIKISGNGRITLGNNVLLNENTFICASGGMIQLETGVTVNRNTMIVSKHMISIGCGCSIGPNVCIYGHDHVFDESGFSKGDFKTGKVVIEDNCWIGAGVIILRNTHIGTGCVIGAGAVVKGDIPPHSIVHSKRELQVKNILS